MFWLRRPLQDEYESETMGFVRSLSSRQPAADVDLTKEASSSSEEEVSTGGWWGPPRRLSASERLKRLEPSSRRKRRRWDSSDDEEEDAGAVVVACSRLFAGKQELYFEASATAKFENSRLVIEFDRKRVWTDYDNMTTFQCQLGKFPYFAFSTKEDGGLGSLAPFYEPGGPPDSRFVVARPSNPEDFCEKVLNGFVFGRCEKLASLYNNGVGGNALEGIESTCLADEDDADVTAFGDLTHSDRKRLRGGEFLNDRLVNWALNMLNERRDRVHVFSTFFYTRMVEEKNAENAARVVERWTKNVQLDRQDLICIPVNESLHWSLAVVCGLPQGRPCLLIFDSLNAHDPDRIALYVKSFLKHQGFSVENIPVVSPRLPRQPNTYDCGIYLILYFLDLVTKQLPLELPEYPTKASLGQRFHRGIFGQSDASRLRRTLIDSFDRESAKADEEKTNVLHVDDDGDTTDDDDPGDCLIVETMSNNDEEDPLTDFRDCAGARATES